MDITITATATLVELTRNASHLAGGPVARELWAGLVATLAENRASTLAGLLATFAWGCVVLTLFALTGREGGNGAGARVGAPGGPSGGADEQVAVALPPRRVLTANTAPAPAPVLVEVVAAARADVPALARADVPVPAQADVPVEAAPSRQAPSPLPVLTGARCRRCTQPRCWPSTGERSPARTLGVSAPRGCRAPVAATAGARCLPASQGRPSACGARGPFRELTPVRRSGPPRGRGPRRHVAAP